MEYLDALTRFIRLLLMSWMLEGLLDSQFSLRELEIEYFISGIVMIVSRFFSLIKSVITIPESPVIQFFQNLILFSEMYGVLINNCYVTDGFGKKSDVIDDKGCVIDPILITGIRYSSDLQRAYAESSVFKFADKPGVWFFCQVQMCMKKHGMCDGITVS